MNISQRSAPGASACASHFRIAQNTTAVQREDMAYTSVSTAENQNVSEKVYANAPTNPAPMIWNYWAVVISGSLASIFFANAVMVQNKKVMVRALESADPTFIQ